MIVMHANSKIKKIILGLLDVKLNIENTIPISSGNTNENVSIVKAAKIP